MKKSLLILFTIITSYVAQAQITFVNAAASGANNGTSWANAYTNLQTALTNTASGSIWVVAGTYYPGTSGSNTATFTLKNNVSILGGFNGTEGGPTQRDPAANVTILSGDLDQSGTLTAADAYHVVSSANAGASAVIDGFTITGGNAVGGGDNDHGGGVYCRPTTISIVGNPKIINCIVKQNYANFYGGGIAIVCSNLTGSSASPQLLNCRIFDNISNGNGTGVYVTSEGSGTSASPNFENCLIYNNVNPASASNFCAEATVGGSVNPILINCTFFGNAAAEDISFYKGATSSTLQMHNCILYDQDVASDAQITGDNNDFNLSANAVWGTGTGNIMSDPIFQNPMAGNFAVSCQSPCINAGSNTYPSATYDILGNPRITASIVDMGAYESSFTLPIVTANATLYNVCAGGTTQLYGTGAISYTWTGGVSDGISFSPTISDSYTVTGTDANGCVNTASLTITVNPLPIIVANASAAGVCKGGSVTLYGTGGSGSYSWTHAVLDNNPFFPTTTQTYTVTGIDANGCQAIDQITVIVEDTVGFNAGSNIDVCRTGTPFVTLNGNSASNPFTWTTLGSGSWVNGSSLTPDYYLSGADASGAFVKIVLDITPAYCPALSDTLTLFMQDPTSAYAGADISVCEGAVSGSLVTASTTGSSAINWSTNGTGTFSSPISPTAFYTFSPADVLAGSVNIGLTSYPVNPVCPVSVDTLTIVIHQTPTFNLGPDVTICETDSILLQTTVSGGTPPYLYNWGNGGTISTANNEYYFPPATSNINLYLMDNFGCVATDTFLVTIDASEMLTINMHIGAGVLTDGTMYMLRFIPQQAVFDTMFPYPFSGGTGTISFNGFPHGNYLIKIVPDTLLYPTLLPTYYGDAFQWDSATVINHNCINPFVADINIIALLSGTGTGSISGEVVEWNGFGNRYNGPNNHIMVPGGPLKGIDVKLGKNPGGGIQARTTTNDAGKYNFDNLPDGNYHIYVDIPGLPMDSFYVVNVVSDSTTNLIYYADSNSVYPILPIAVGIKDYKTELMGMGVHPNPATNYTKVVFETISVNSTTQLKVFDVTGKMAMSLNLTNLPKGKHEYHLNFANQQLQSGIYFIELLNENGKQIKKLIVE